MRKLSGRLTRELIERGNLPISAEGIVRLRPDIAGEVDTAQKLLDDEIELRPWDVECQQPQGGECLLEAHFVAMSESAEQHHLFMLEGSDSDGDRIKRWSKMSVSYGSLVQVTRFLTDAWGEIRELQLQQAKTHMYRQN